MNVIEFYAHIVKENEKLKKEIALLSVMIELLSLQYKDV